MTSRASTRASSKKPPAPKESNCAACTKPNKTLAKLPCNHALCQPCLKKCVKPQEKPKGKNAKKPPDEYDCPVCKAEAEEAAAKAEEELKANAQPDLGHGECGPCAFEGKQTFASGFCVECGELLCNTCSGEHNKFKTIRRHTILTGDQIPKDTGAMSRITLLMVCPEHNDKDLEYYCADHNEMGCGACININHRRCERVMFIKDVAEEPTDKKLCTDAAMELKQIKKNFEDITRDTGEVIDSLEKQRDAIRQRRDHIKGKILELLDKLETSCELEMEQIIQKSSNDLGGADSGGSRGMINEIQKTIELLEAAVGHATDPQLFVAAKRSAYDREKFINSLNKAMGSISDIRMDYKPDQTMERMLRSMQIFEGHTIQVINTRGNAVRMNYDVQGQSPGRSMSISQPNLRAHPHQMVSASQPNLREVGYVTRTDANIENGDHGFDRPGTDPIRFPKFDTPRLENRVSNHPFRRSGTVSEFNGYQPTQTDYYQSRSVPQSPRQRTDYSMNRSLGDSQTSRPVLQRAGTFQGQGFNELRMNGDYPSPRSVQSEPNNIYGMHRSTTTYRELLPANQRIAGTNSLVGQGLNQPSRADILANERQVLQRQTSEMPRLNRRESSQSLLLSPRQANAITLPEHEFSKMSRQDILSQSSPIKNRSHIDPTITPFRNRKAVLVGQFNVRLLSDEYVCGLKGAAFLPDGRIALADYDNHNIKLFDSKVYRGSHLRLSSGPWDITVTGHKEMAVSLPFESKIQFVSVGEELKPTRSIKMEMDCYGLICRNQELIVVCNDYLVGPAIQIMTMTGRIKQIIDTDKAGRRILTDPYYLAVSFNNKAFYVTDKDRIVCMDRIGNVTSVYQDAGIRNARGIDTDHEGNLYVCGYMSNNVYQVTEHGIDFRCLITKEQVWDPWSVTFNESNGTILVTCDGSDTVKIYSLQ